MATTTKGLLKKIVKFNSSNPVEFGDYEINTGIGLVDGFKPYGAYVEYDKGQTFYQDEMYKGEDITTQSNWVNIAVYLDSLSDEELAKQFPKISRINVSAEEQTAGNGINFAVNGNFDEVGNQITIGYNIYKLKIGKPVNADVALSGFKEVLASDSYDDNTKFDLQTVINSKMDNPSGWVSDLEAQGLGPARIDYLLSIIGLKVSSNEKQWKNLLKDYENIVN